MRGQLERGLTVVLLIVLIVAVAGVIYIAVNPPETSEPYTEFYVLGPEGNASDYPTNLSVGEEGEFIVGITNQEHRTVTYTVVVTVDGEPVEQREVTVEDDETWEDTFAYTPESPGEKRVRLLLYQSTEPDLSAEPDEFLRLVVTVTEDG